MKLIKLAILFLFSMGLPCLAQTYPNKPVKIIVPFAAGGPADNYARFIALRLQDELKTPFIVDDKPGAGSIIGTDFVAKSAPDGYTLLMMSNAQTVNESLVENKPFNLMKDFVAIAPINYSDLVLVTNASLQFKNLGELIQFAKANPNVLTFASSGTGTPYHFAGELFNSMAGVKILHVPYKGSSGARTDVLGGQVNMMFDAVTTMSEYVKSNQVKAMGTTGLTRSPILPGVPTIAEAGVPKFETTIWLGLMAPAGTPKEIVDMLNKAVNKIQRSQEVVDLWAKQGATPLSMGPAAFTNYLNADIQKWASIVKSAGIKAQ
ncbi:tripartite tricarboxylate transporter substrate binding protein [Polynucleobacter sp. Latsch14-2]|jgi:tripartite-type tricarboxylate transporter receptor subunit TctC|uniref:tripartite tricarboxylate transporter substrate binding protein n=1 Tax=Polynucleobacter sp. Latsch14-2 TaxID=2576920 RepID=UPI001C0B1825|nr:tripartite tricarboxylate transporter substrate binding protein [Polynucleobacter sp. Latsch14-2]MBU3614247.1 tripartite tricarboxylate transporter substrate binding protein [Polynucleobacter sp. Latsch14-2]